MNLEKEEIFQKKAFTREHFEKKYKKVRALNTNKESREVSQQTKQEIAYYDNKLKAFEELDFDHMSEENIAYFTDQINKAHEQYKETVITNPDIEQRFEQLFEKLKRFGEIY